MKRLGVLLLAAVCLAFAGTAGAQDKYPSKAVKILVPYAPGGATDIISRVVGEQMRQILGQSFVVENKPGAFGILAIEEMARSKPDGYTLMIGNVSTNAITPVLFKKKFAINFEKDVLSVSRLAIYPSFLVTTTAQGFEPKSVAELVAYAKKNPGKVRYTSAGIGSFPHYDVEVFAKRAGVEMLHIPNKAGDVGTLHWQSMLAPANTPKDVLATLFKAIGDASKAPALQEAFAKQLVSVKPSASLDEAQTWLNGELAAWRKTVAEVKIEMAE